MINENTKDKIETELKRATLTLFNDNRDLEIPNLESYTQRANNAVKNQMKELNDIFSLKNDALKIEKELETKFQNDNANPKKHSSVHFGASDKAIEAIIHGRIQEHENVELDYTSRTYTILQEAKEESSYARSVVRNLLKDELLNVPSNKYVAPNYVSNSVVKEITKDIGGDGTYKVVDAVLNYQTTGPDIEGSKLTPVRASGILYVDKKGDDILAFVDQYQDYYNSKDNGIKKISVADERVDSIHLSEATYRSVKLDLLDQKIENAIYAFEDSMKRNLQPIYNEKKTLLDGVTNHRREVLNTQNKEERLRVIAEKEKNYITGVENSISSLSNESGVAFKDAKAGSFYTSRDDIDYSFLVEFGKDKNKTTYEIALPKDSLNPFQFDSKNPETGISEETHIRIDSNVKNPTSGVPLIFDNKGKEVSYYGEENNKQVALKKIVDTFEDISIVTPEQLHDEYAQHRLANNKKPLSIEENKHGVLDEVNIYLKSKINHSPEFSQALEKEFKQKSVKPTV